MVSPALIGTGLTPPPHFPESTSLNNYFFLYCSINTSCYALESLTESHCNFMISPVSGRAGSSSTVCPSMDRCIVGHWWLSSNLKGDTAWLDIWTEASNLNCSTLVAITHDSIRSNSNEDLVLNFRMKLP